MKQRFITAFVLIALLAVVMIVGSNLWFIVAGILTVVATHELVTLCNQKWPKVLSWSIYVFMLCLCLSGYFSRELVIFFDILYFMYLLAWLVFNENVTFDQIGLLYLFSNVLGFMFLALFEAFSLSRMTFFLFLGSPIVVDTGALFVGLALGKHKLNERISPNKSVEGAIGGYIVGFIFIMICGYFGVVWIVDDRTMCLLFVYALTCPIVGQIGDLAFSAIKRHYNVKDFGNIFPGHGGVLDRFDSISFGCCWALALMVLFL